MTLEEIGREIREQIIRDFISQWDKRHDETLEQWKARIGDYEYRRKVEEEQAEFSKSATSEPLGQAGREG